MLATACFDGPLDKSGSRGNIGGDYFISGQRYAGQYLLESQHGRGVCLYPSGPRYQGYMYAGAAEFCGRVTFPSGACYQGVFAEGQPHGAGHVTYPHGTQDSGVWCRGRLLRLLQPYPAGVPFNLLLTGHYVDWYQRKVLDVKEPECALDAVLRELEGGKTTAEFTTQQLDQLTNLRLRDRRTAAFPTHRYSGVPTQQPVVRMQAWNDDREICEVQQHTFLTERNGKLDTEVASICLSEFLRPGRVAALPAGRLERASRLLLHASTVNRADVVRLLLRTVRLTADVTDSTGLSALICAAIRGHVAAVNMLLDHGADVNHVTDEGVSALSLCLALHHPDFKMKFHLDQLNVFTYPDLTKDYSGVMEWLGGEPTPLQVQHRTFPSRPLPAEKKPAKGRRRTRANKKGANRPSPLPDIRMALVPGPGLDCEEEPPTPAPPLPASVRSTPAPPPPVSVRSTPRRPGTPGFGSGHQEIPVDSAGSPVGGGSPAGDHGATSEDAGSAAAPVTTPRSGADASAASQAGAADPADPADAAAPSPAADEAALPPSWSSVWPQEEMASPSQTAAVAAADAAGSVRTVDGADSDWERLSAGSGLRCCPSLDQLLVAVQSRENRQETAVRLIEAFCCGEDGDWEQTEYSRPRPESQDMLPMIKLLLRRGASPDASQVPFPAIHHAMLADDKPLMVALLSAGGDPNGRLAPQLGTLAPLHISCALPGEACLAMTQILLSRGADANVTADPNPALLDLVVLEKRGLEVPQSYGCRRPIHVACDRPSETYQDRVTTRVLMDRLQAAGADIEALCSGHTPVTLALRNGDLTLAVDLMTRGACPLRPLGPPHWDALGLAVSPAMEDKFKPEDRKQLVRTLVAYGSDLLWDYPLSPTGEGEGAEDAEEERKTCGNILDFATWINHVDDTILTCSPHQLKGPQRAQKKNREAFLEFLAGLVQDEVCRHEQMSPLVLKGLFEDAELPSAEASAEGGRASRGGTSGRGSRKATGDPKAHRKRKRLLLSAECFCPLCDRVLGKCMKGCPNYGAPMPKLSPADMDALELEFGDDFLGSSEEEDGKTARRGRRKKRRAEATDDSTGVHLEVGALLDENGKPLKCAACHKVIKRRKVVCSACKAVNYCSKQCRAKDWEGGHSRTCPGRSQISLTRLESQASRTSAGGGSHSDDGLASERATAKDGKSRKKRHRGGGASDSDESRRGRSLQGGKHGKHHSKRGAHSLDGEGHGHGLTPMKMPPGLAAFLRQFQGLSIGACKHLILGEWYEDDCKMKENYSFI